MNDQEKNSSHFLFHSFCLIVKKTKKKLFLVCVYNLPGRFYHVSFVINLQIDLLILQHVHFRNQSISE